MIAENLDQNSLADAFRKFPTDTDRVRDRDRNREATMSRLNAQEEAQSGLDPDDFSDDEEEDEEEEDDSDEEEEDDKLDKSSDGAQDSDDDDDGGGKAVKDIKDPDVAHLEDSGEPNSIHPTKHSPYH